MSQPTPTPPSLAAPPPAARFAARVVDDPHELAALQVEWEELAGDAIEPSPSSEAWMLLPSLRRLAGGTAVDVVTIRSHEPEANDERGRLCAVFAVETRRGYRGLPIRTLRMWNHLYALFPAPLVRRGTAEDSIRAFLRWAGSRSSGPCLVECPDLRTDSEFFDRLSHVVRTDAIANDLRSVTTRAVFRRRSDADAYLELISTMRLRRYERRLAELGTLAYDEPVDPADPAEVSRWVEEFMALEAAGWKGREGTAFAANAEHREWLLEVCRGASARGRIMMLALRLDGRAIAMKINIMGGSGGYAFKTAFDEAHSRYSPGTLLELEHIRRLHARPGIAWMDSLAGPEHTLANRVWQDRIGVAHWLLATGTGSGLLMALLPLLRWVKRAVGRSPSSASEP